MAKTTASRRPSRKGSPGANANGSSASGTKRGSGGAAQQSLLEESGAGATSRGRSSRTVPPDAVRSDAVRSDAVPSDAVPSIGSAAGDPIGYEAGFGGPQVCSLVHISYRQLDYWARTGLLKPSIAAAHGSGTKRRYSYRDLVQLKVIKQLLDAGISLHSARRAIDCLRSHLGEELAASKLVLTGTTAVLVRSDGDVVDLLAGGQGVFNIVPLAGVVDALDADMVRLRRAEPGPEHTGAAPLGEDDVPQRRAAGAQRGGARH